MKKILTCTAAVVLAAVCAVCAAGCSTGSKGLTPDTGLTGGVAATVNGAEIPEDTITRQINTQRINAEAEDDDAWAEYLHNMDSTPTKQRDEALEVLIDRELVKQFAGDEDCAATDEEIQEQVDKVRANYSSDEAWQEALEGSNYADEQAYRDQLSYSIAYQKLEDKFTEEANVDDATLIEQAQTQLADAAGTTMRHSSHILFDTDDEAQAQEVLDKLKSGELDFAEAAKEYSTDTGSAEEGGDVGWDGMTTFVEEYQNALDGLQVGEMTDLVPSQYGYHIIKCTDIAEVPETITSVDQVPSDILADIRTQASSTQTSEKMESWLDEKEEASDVVINDMPENVPYNVDMSAYETEEEENAEDEAADEELVENVEGVADDVDAAAVEGEGVTTDAEPVEGDAGTTEPDAAAETEGEAATDQSE